MTASVSFEEQVEIPLHIGNLAEFRRWVMSDSFPVRGRIDYIAGRIEVNMTPENIFSHGTLKTKIAAAVLERAENLALGHVLVDSSRIANVAAKLSAEPDIMLVSQAAIDKGQVQLVPAASGEPDQFVEFVGSPDLIVEIVSDGSVRKDTERLPAAYFIAGVTEYWLVDARRNELVYQIYQRGAERFVLSPVNNEGYQQSQVLKCRYRLERSRGLGGFWQYALHAAT